MEGQDLRNTKPIMNKILNLFAIVFLLHTTPILAGEALDPRGPIDNPGMNVTADAEGVQTHGYQFQNDCAKPTPWQAHWISLGSGESLFYSKSIPLECVMFRKEVVLADAPQTVKAWMTADIRYRLYINGRLVARGPVDQGRDYFGGGTERWFYDYRDLTPFFTKGTNVITAEVFRDWPINFTVSRGQPGFLFEAEITDGSGQKTKVTSDASWHSLAAAQYPNASVYIAANEPAGWRLPGFDDSAWPASHEVKDIWEPLVPSEIPPLMEARYPVLRYEGLPVDRVFTNDGSFKVVFDRVLSAYPTIKVRGGKGALLTISANHVAKFIPGGGESYFEFPFMTEVVPSFTVELTHVTEPVTIEDVGANFTSQPLEYKGAFECSDPKLNDLWKVSRWAVQICLQTHHLDSPNHQEPISDPGDYVIEGMVNNYAFAQPWLARQDIRKFAWVLEDEHYHNFHTSYSIAWLQMLMDYYDYTGDKSLVVEMSPYVHKLMDTYASWRGANGILSEAPNYMFMDWVNIGGFPCHHPPAVIGQGYLTAFFYHGLEMAARVATLTGDTASVEKYAQLRQEIKTAFNRELWVADKGLYRDGKPFQTSVQPGTWLPADQDIETFSPHVNMLAVLFDLAPKAQQAAIVDKVMAEQPLNTQPWFMYWVFKAIDHAGRFDQYGTAQIRRWQIMPETQSFLEMWNTGDLSHGWCSSPLVQMSARVLGVTPASPGFDTIAIRPELCDLTWAKGSVPTPHGDVAVSWDLGENKIMTVGYPSKSEDKLTLDVTVPTGAEADITLPVSRFERSRGPHIMVIGQLAPPQITMNGKKVGASVHTAAGQYHFEITGQLKPLTAAN
jgi:hypothetical protein